MSASVPILKDGRPVSGLGHYLRDVVYGANDGVVTTFAIVAGASGASLGGAIALVLGLANLVADGVSMGASNYLALKSELEQRGADVAAEAPLRHGAATFVAFAIAGAIPLLAFPAANLLGLTPFPLACGLAAITLAAVGALRAPFVRKGVVRSAGEMLGIGAIAGGAAYLVGFLAGGLVGAGT